MSKIISVLHEGDYVGIGRELNMSLYEYVKMQCLDKKYFIVFHVTEEEYLELLTQIKNEEKVKADNHRYLMIYEIIGALVFSDYNKEDKFGNYILDKRGFRFFPYFRDNFPCNDVDYYELASYKNIVYTTETYEDVISHYGNKRGYTKKANDNKKVKFYIGSKMKNCNLVDYYANKLKEKGFEQTYNWVNAINTINNAKFKDNLIKVAKLEQQGIIDADIVIILLPSGRGTHIELGMALGLKKEIFLCSENEEDFNTHNTVAFYELPNIVRLVGTADENIEKILKMCIAS